MAYSCSMKNLLEEKDIAKKQKQVIIYVKITIIFSPGN